VATCYQKHPEMAPSFTKSVTGAKAPRPPPAKSTTLLSVTSRERVAFAAMGGEDSKLTASALNARAVAAATAARGSDVFKKLADCQSVSYNTDDDEIERADADLISGLARLGGEPDAETRQVACEPLPELEHANARLSMPEFGRVAQLPLPESRRVACKPKPEFGRTV
jgi:hypothetical protein